MPTITKFVEDKLQLVLSFDELYALSEKVRERFEAKEWCLDEDYKQWGYKATACDLVIVRDLHLIGELLEKKVESMTVKRQKKIKFQLPVSYVFILHAELTQATIDPYLQFAIDQIDRVLKGYKRQDRLRLRK